MIRKSEVINSMSIYVEGLGFISNSAKCTLPEIEFVEFETTSGVSEHGVTTTVLKKMEATFELNEVNKVYFEALSKRQNEKATFWLKENTNKNSGDSQTVVTLKGAIKKLALPESEVGKEAKSTITLSVDFFKHEKDGYTNVLVDIDNLVCEIAGKDIWQEQREFLIG